MCGYLVELHMVGILSADNVRYVEFVRCNNGDHFRLNGPAAIAQAMTGLYLNLKREAWSGWKALGALIRGLQMHGIQAKSPHGQNPTELLICHDTLAEGNFDAFSKLPGNVHQKDYLSVIKYFAPLKFNDDGNLESYPNACTDGEYRYNRNGTAGSYRCCRHHNGCKASIVMDKKGNITRIWEKKNKTNPHSEECLNPPTKTDSRKGKKKRGNKTFG
jgi:hypothetical protein